jgi:hypothetical protein
VKSRRIDPPLYSKGLDEGFLPFIVLVLIATLLARADEVIE